MASPSTPSIHKRSNNDASSSSPPVQKRFKFDASPSTPSIHKRFTYDVFLSFRGEDTRTNFVDHLYYALQHKGIHTYKDDERIKKGKKISDELIGSINDSKLYIIVFSKNYASSSWCLDELLKIMECQKTTGHTAYPVFYDVEPSEVRKQSGAVKEAFAKHENEEDAVKWRKALKEAADLAGWELADGHEAKFIQKVVEELSLELRGINFTIDEKLVGIENRINDVLSSLETGDDDAHMIGIQGMGGAGKTTLARAIFDQISFQFEGKSFVENVRELSGASFLGLKSLQNQILSDVFNDKCMTVSSVHEGICTMKRMMPCKKVILVLDDVDHREQLKVLAGDITWFKPGSIIIITTRDRQVLEFYEEKSIHDVQLLSDEDAMCLFRRYAFGKVIPNSAYEELSRQYVKYAAGLPLAIEVLGSFLCGKDELEWRDALLRLKAIPSQEILKILEISYHGLEEEYKEIFLNIACFLKNWPKAIVIKVLESCGFYARIGLRVLEQKSLIAVKYGILGMHDHIRELGMNIVRRSHPHNPNKHSRLWIDEEIKEILAKDLGTEATRYIRFNIGKLSPEIAMQGLRKMKELIYLEVYVPFTNASERDCSLQNWNFNELQNSLRFLCWQGYPFRSLPTTFQADNLVSLKITHSRIVQLWEGGERKVLNKLRFLDLSYSKLRTFDIELSPNLEHLNLSNCHNLEEFYMANGCLKKLVYLDLSGSLRFTSFEFQVGGESSWSEDESLEGGPLAELHLIAESVDECRFHPDSNLPKFLFKYYYKEDRPLLTRNLEKLISVGLCACTNLDHFSRSICGLQHLTKLKLEGSILEAPKDLDQLECLHELYFSCKKIKHLPDNICVLKHLKSIDLLHCSLLEKLPEDLGQLACLENLDFSFTNIQVLPGSICKLKHLESLSLDGCWLLKKLPENIGQLECLKKLDLSNTAVKELPDGICMLKHLESLNLNHCSLLKKLPKNLGQIECLKELQLSFSKIKILPDSICMLQHLESLDLTNCSLLEKLPEDLGRLECLKDLKLRGCELLREVPDSICKMKCLKELVLKDCIRVEKLPEEFGRLECLKLLYLQNTSISHLPQSILLKGLRIYGSRGLLQSFGLTSEIQQCSSLHGTSYYVDV